MSLAIGTIMLWGSCYFLIYEIVTFYQRKKSPEYQRLKSFQKELRKNEHILDRLGDLLMPIIKKIPRKDKIESFIIRGGSPYDLTFKRYVVVKIGLTIFTIWLARNSSPLMQTISSLFGFFAIDILIWSKAKKREEEILKELPYMITKIARSTANGVPIREVLMVLSSRLQGPLGEEVSRLSAHYNIDGNLSRCLPVFSKRIGMEDVDNMAMAIIQAEQSGKMRAILEKQAEILKRRESFKAFKSTKNRSNFLPLTTVGMVICIFLLVAVPMFLLIATDGLFR
ncbi:type II secretion system F family protein [Ammoniphilus resinae]|uniref:Flp pilus assembly protein TadB n=1 Tax=Ammoniphilus resinae TaxID=861532 RepID=A0ABS4GNG5_9BACL|nr:type II secretion system F family protein [Ammoniphilus resinae]MBP1931815.1 Flp pilus assembly protein TadB [Ammoniphilus resinae]